MYWGSILYTKARCCDIVLSRIFSYREAASWMGSTQGKENEKWNWNQWRRFSRQSYIFVCEYFLLMPVVLSERENSLNISFPPAVGLSSLKIVFCSLCKEFSCMVESKLRVLVVQKLDRDAHISLAHMNPTSITGPTKDIFMILIMAGSSLMSISASVNTVHF